MNRRKLLLNERVEVRQFEEGLRGSWHPGVVVGVSNLFRSIEYDELLCEAGDSKLIESIPVTEAIEGLHSRRHVPSTYRGHIRPLPPLSQPYSDQKLGFGVCVDALFEDAWWEGVILDNDDNASERSVYFPDEGDECKFSVSQLRVAHEWDEFMGIWRERGVWIMVQLAKELEGDVPLACCVKKVWSSLRLNYGFIKMISEWTCGVQTVWKKYFMEVVQEIAVGSSRRNLANRKILAWMVGKKGNKLKDPGEANPHLSDTFMQAGSCNDLKAVKSCQKGKGRGSLGKHKGRKRSVMSKLKHEELSTLNTSTRKSFQADKSCGEKQMTSGVSLIKSNYSINESDQIPDHFTDANKEILSSPLPIQKESGKLESEIDKQKSSTVCENEGNQFSVDSSGGSETISYAVSHVQDNKSACRSSRKHGQIDNNLAGIFPDCSKVQVSRQGFFSVIHKKRRSSLMRKRISNKYQRPNLKVTNPLKVGKGNNKAFFVVYKLKSDSVMRKRFSKKPKQADSKVEAIPKKRGKGLYAILKEDDLISGHHHLNLPFDNCGKKVRLKDMVSRSRRRKRKWRCRGSRLRDTICSVCHYGGDLIICDHCPCSYHLSCINFKDVPSKKWFCPSCCCGLCGLRDSKSYSEQFTNACLQCSRQYHVACLSEVQNLSPADYPFGSFCSEACYKLCSQLHQLLGISNPTAVDGLSWTLMRSLKTVYKFPDMSKTHTWIKLSSVLKVIHECFEPVKEPHTKRDLVRDVLFNSVSKLKRLDFRGFYAMVLHNGDEILSVATVRIHGLKAAEMPLVATPFQYRRQGMCRLLLQELEKLLTQLGIERLVLPAIPQLRETWEKSFGFLEMPLSERLQFLGYPFLAFQGTIMLHKFLKNPMNNKEMRGKSLGLGGNTSNVGMKLKQGSVSKDRFCGLFYKRRPKMKVTGKENLVNNRGGLTQLSENLHKRRRILTSRD
ncbi:PREDICTED: uncharacterized protein LOC18611905 [Theobroma cacao]|uniref:Uncharacterized protein LOC18611905 n=1 Tax=Theobroma cacao TaxID=3641 RepID=A0AB32X249_THECC|nr:PREDICTED: uncharacterized protein LOC18611905 [Theobroma cacao]XP_017984563.1 PREDICTED: uncharacterized protein LOC18611905 [Theobroma cacao]XP_017984568.1 PREDICTED: uncharacterized protein LOC18611905 [Theobroma cacao]